MLAVAFNCVPSSGVGYVISAGLFHVTTGVAFRTLTTTSFEPDLQCVSSADVKSTCKVWPLPAFRTVPVIGVYSKVPVDEAVAFN